MTTVKTLGLGLLLATIVASCGTSTSTSDIDRASENDEGADKVCTYTQGYWKNHPEIWPVDSLAIGNVTYSKDELLLIFREPVRGNGLILLAHQLIAAKLNVALGVDDEGLLDELNGCDGLIADLVIPPLGDGRLEPSSVAAIANELDEFNNADKCEAEDGEDGVCGNGVVEQGEQCDDGNTIDTDSCTNLCELCPDQAPVCGNGVVEQGEQCDDGNTVNDDVCRNDCTLCPDQAPVCGNGVVEQGEQCDDGNTIDTDSCTNLCQLCPAG